MNKISEKSKSIILISLICVLTLLFVLKKERILFLNSADKKNQIELSHFQDLLADFAHNGIVSYGNYSESEIFEYIAQEDGLIKEYFFEFDGKKNILFGIDSMAENEQEIFSLANQINAKIVDKIECSDVKIEILDYGFPSILTAYLFLQKGFKNIVLVTDKPIHSIKEYKVDFKNTVENQIDLIVNNIAKNKILSGGETQNIYYLSSEEGVGFYDKAGRMKRKKIGQISEVVSNLPSETAAKIIDTVRDSNIFVRHEVGIESVSLKFRGLAKLNKEISLNDILSLESEDRKASDFGFYMIDFIKNDQHKVFQSYISIKLDKSEVEKVKMLNKDKVLVLNDSFMFISDCGNDICLIFGKHFSNNLSIMNIDIRQYAMDAIKDFNDYFNYEALNHISHRVNQKMERLD